MSTTFFGLELARRALSSQQAALNITGHNIANANTQGYTRQVGNLSATTPYNIPVSGKNLSLGTGVTLDTITRARDAYIDRQFRGETSKQQYWAGRQDSLQKIEGMLNEPSDSSLHSDMDNLWNAWSDLAKNPENMGARSVVRERALTLTESFHHISQQISDMRENLDSNIKVQVHQINNYGQQIKDLNDQIKRSEVAGDNPNDLRDKRDVLVDELSKIVSVRVVESKDPSFTDRNVNNFKVIIGNENSTENNTLVDDSTVRFLEEPPPQKTISGYDSSLVVWSDDPNPIKIELDLGTKLGILAANIAVRDYDLPKFGEQFDLLAQGIANAVNALHQTGQGLTVEGDVGINFFTDGTATPVLDAQGLPIITASTITLNVVIEGNLNRIATGTIPLDNSTPPIHDVDIDGNPIITVGDGSIARALSSLASGWSALQSLIDTGKFGAIDQTPVSGTSFGDFYGANVAQMGVDVQQANRMKEGQDVLVVHLSNQRESLSGVSLDEEMTNLVKFQKSYSAAARLVTMMDDMLDTIVNRMGMTR